MNNTSSMFKPKRGKIVTLEKSPNPWYSRYLDKKPNKLKKKKYINNTQMKLCKYLLLILILFIIRKFWITYSKKY